MDENQYIEMLRLRHTRIIEEIRALEEQKRLIVKEMAAKQELAKHLAGLLSAEGHGVPGTAGGTSRPIDIVFDHLDRPDGRLKEPVHYKDMAKFLEEEGIPISGKDPAASLLTQISRDSRFIRLGPGSYGLARFPGANTPKAKAARKSSRRKRLLTKGHPSGQDT